MAVEIKDGKKILGNTCIGRGFKGYSYWRYCIPDRRYYNLS